MSVKASLPVTLCLPGVPVTDAAAALRELSLTQPTNSAQMELIEKEKAKIKYKQMFKRSSFNLQPALWSLQAFLLRWSCREAAEIHDWWSAMDAFNRFISNLFLCERWKNKGKRQICWWVMNLTWACSSTWVHFSSVGTSLSSSYDFPFMLCGFVADEHPGCRWTARLLHAPSVDPYHECSAHDGAFSHREQPRSTLTTLSSICISFS